MNLAICGDCPCPVLGAILDSTIVVHQHLHSTVPAMSSPPPLDDTSVIHSALINAKLVVIETVTANKKNKREKVIKNKQFTHKFELSEANYVELLNAFLKIHHIQKYQATTNHIFTFKIQVPPAKYRRWVGSTSVCLH